MMMKRTWVLNALTAAVLLATLSVQAQGRVGDKAAATAPAAPAVQATPATPVVATRSTETTPAPANNAIRVLLIADRETTMSSPVTAKIKMLYVSIGVKFEAGQTLATFDCDESIARMNIATAELSGAVETHEAKVRMQGLDQASDVEVAIAASGAAKGRAQVELQRAQVDLCTMKAPWAGRVAKVHVRTHMSVTPGQAMVDLVKSGPLRLKLNAPSHLVGKLKAGRLFDVVIDETGRSYPARMLALNSRVDPVSQTIEIEAAIAKNYPELLPGMSGVANLGSLR
jgi:multidrug efflux pump subunit AcrA (membrane-fusion protein)